MLQSLRDQEATAVAKSAILRLIGADAVDHIEVFPTEDQFGEEGLSVTIFLRTTDQTEAGPRLSDAIVAVGQALREAGDPRFPYVTFLAPGYEHAEDDPRPAA